MAGVVKFGWAYKNKATVETEDFELLRESLSIENKKYNFEKKHNSKAQRRFYPITKGGKFEFGLFFMIKQKILDLAFGGVIEYSEEFKKRCVPRYDIANISKLKYDLYDYQNNAIKNMFKYGRGVCNIGTGGGKTYIMAVFLKNVITKHPQTTVFILVPTLQLVEQTYSDFIEYGFSETEISKWSGENKFINSRIIVGNVGICDKKTEHGKNIFNRSILIIDEVHILKKDNEINSFVDKFVTPNRFGFTGTMPEEIKDQWNVIGKTGKIIFKKKGKELRDEGRISNLKLNIILIEYNYQTYSDLEEAVIEYNEEKYVKNKYIPEIEFLIGHAYRNKVISTLAIKDKNVLIMVDRIEHGEILHEMLKDKGRTCVFIHGDVEVDTREEIRKLMENTDNVICIAISKVFSTGINIKNLNYIIFATAGKAKVKIIQSIGRGLRLHKNKEKLIVYDIADDTRYGNSHLKKRKILYNDEGIDYNTYRLKEK